MRLSSLQNTFGGQTPHCARTRVRSYMLPDPIAEFGKGMGQEEDGEGKGCGKGRVSEGKGRGGEEV